MVDARKAAGPSILPLILAGILLAVITNGGEAPEDKPGKHRAPPFIGNVQITIRVEQDQQYSKVTWDVGAGNVNKVGRAPGRSWTDVAKPNQRVAVNLAPNHYGEYGRLWVQMYQMNNGRIICTGENTQNRKAPTGCTGIVLI